MAARLAFFVIATALLLLLTFAISTDLEPEELGTAPGFSYSGNTGPDKWGSLSPTYATCSKGKSQSPIDIIKKKVVRNKNLKPLRGEYYPVNATLVDRGYNVGMVFGNAAGALIVNGKNYTLLQMHWHSPSEHKINGVTFDVELHIVHMASDGSLAVIAVLYKIGNADPIIAKIQSKLAELAKEVYASHELAQITVGTFDTLKLRRNTRKYYRYVGSLTTPPCTENVIWHIFGKERTISKEQIEALKAPVNATCKKNRRPVQPLNGRRVELFDDEDEDEEFS